MMRLFTDIEEARRVLLARPPANDDELPERFREGIRRVFGRDLTAIGVAEEVCRAVQREGDRAVRHFTREIDGVAVDAFELPLSACTDALTRLPDDLRSALEAAAERVRVFHEREHHDSWWNHTGGDVLGQIILPLERVGVYVPAGTAAYPSSLLMSVIPAKVAEVPEVIVTTPPHPKGVPDVILAACAIAGVDRVFTVGGAQGIAALAYGTESVPKVDMIVGPGNPFVAAAKRYVFGQVAIDQIAGPTETVVIADDTANPAWVAADLIAQAEHGETSSAILLALNEAVARVVDAEVERQLADLPRADVVRASMATHGGALVVPDIETGIVLANAYAPEHLCLCVRDPWQYVGLVRNAGGVFVGEYSPEVLGDYIAGPSHIMPTGGTARFSSAMHVGDFLRTMSVVGLTPRTASALSASAAMVAHAEGLDGHARAAKLRADG